MFRCPDCGWRGWALGDESIIAAVSGPTSIPEPPNLRASPLARTERREIRLEELDRIE